LTTQSIQQAPPTVQSTTTTQTLYPDLHFSTTQPQAPPIQEIPNANNNANNNANINAANNNNSIPTTSPLVQLIDFPEVQESLKEQNKKLACKFFKSWSKGLVAIESENQLCGTYVIGGTQFTKTWRLRNLGLIPWLQGSVKIFNLSFIYCFILFCLFSK